MTGSRTAGVGSIPPGVGSIPPGRRPALGGLVDRGAVTAAYVGLGVAVVLAISFLLIIPIEPIYTALALPAGLLIGYYAGVRSTRTRGEWGRFLGNALFAGAVTGITLAALLLGIKALFFFGDNGFRAGAGPLACRTGADCVYQRYLEAQPADLQAAGVTDAAGFATLYWAQQTGTAGLLLGVSVVAALAGGVIYGLRRPAAGSVASVAVEPGVREAPVAAPPEAPAEPSPAEPSPAEPATEDAALGELAVMFAAEDADPTPGSDLLDPAKLDFSLLSLGHVDEYLDAVRKRALSDRDRAVVVLRAGAYVGEVIRRNAETRTYHWVDYAEAIRIRPSIADTSGPSVETSALLWAGGQRFVFPLGKVSKLLDTGREDSVQLFGAATARL